MLDNLNIIVQRDPENALRVASEQWKQILFSANCWNGWVCFGGPDN